MSVAQATLKTQTPLLQYYYRIFLPYFTEVMQGGVLDKTLISSHVLI